MDRVGELIVVAFQNFDGLGVGHMAEFGGQHMVQPVQETFVHKLVEEVHFLRGLFRTKAMMYLIMSSADALSSRTGPAAHFRL